MYLDVSEHRRSHSLGLAGTSLPPTGTWEGCDRGEMVVHNMVKELLPGAMRSAGEREGEEERGREGGEEEEKGRRGRGEGRKREGERGGEGRGEKGGEEHKYGLSHN